MNIDFDPTIDLTIDPENIEYIPIDEFSEQAKKSAVDMIADLSNIYYNEEFMQRHPKFKARVDMEIDSLRVLIKMRKTNEAVHDVIVKAIASNSSNASMYASLTKVQSTLLDIQKQMDLTIKNINLLLKGFQTEIDFETNNKTEEIQTSIEETDKSVYRGTKDFISDMLKKEELG